MALTLEDKCLSILKELTMYSIDLSEELVLLSSVATTKANDYTTPSELLPKYLSWTVLEDKLKPIQYVKGSEFMKDCSALIESSLHNFHVDIKKGENKMPSNEALQQMEGIFNRISARLVDLCRDAFDELRGMEGVKVFTRSEIEMIGRARGLKLLSKWNSNSFVARMNRQKIETFDKESRFSAGKDAIEHTESVLTINP